VDFVTIREAKKNFLRLIRRVANGEQVVITRAGEPIARLIPCAHPSQQRKPGSLKGQLQVGKEFFAPLPPEELAAWE
jgi:prevent-host-death family protein